MAQPVRAHMRIGRHIISGLRVDISEKNSIAEIIDINDPVLLHGDFGQPGKPLPLSLIAIVRRKMPAQKEKDIVSIGCHFFEVAKKSMARTAIPGSSQKPMWASLPFPNG